MDRIQELAKILDTKRSYKVITKHMLKIFLVLSIITSKKHFQSGLINRGKPDCTYYCRVDAKHNSFNEKLELLIKPDHSNNRVMRALMQKGNKIVFNIAENKDKFSKSSKKIFWLEEKRLEREILHELKTKLMS